MTTQDTAGAAALVGEIDDVRRRTRRASRGAAVPLALLGLLVAGSAPLYALAYGTTLTGSDGFVMAKEPAWTTRVLPVHGSLGARDFAVSVYWLVGVPVVFLAITAYYARRARRTGLSLNGWRVAGIGMAVYAALLGALAALTAANGVRPHGVGRTGFLNPLLVVVFGVFALAWVERSKAVLAAAVVFLAGVFFVDTEVFPGNGTGSAWDNLEGWGTATLLLGCWLLLCAGVTALVRTRKAPA